MPKRLTARRGAVSPAKPWRDDDDGNPAGGRAARGSRAAPTANGAACCEVAALLVPDGTRIAVTDLELVVA